MKKIRYIKGVFAVIGGAIICDIAVNAQETTSTTLQTIDQANAITATGLMLGVGVVIFLVRNRKMLGRRLRHERE